MNHKIRLTISQILILAGCFAKSGIAQPARDAPAPVSVAPVIRQEVAAGQIFVASVAPSKRAVIGTAVEGRVSEILADEGSRIVAKQPLARILTTTIELELKGAEAELALRQAELGELKNGTQQSEIDQAKAKMLAAKANLDFARSAFERLNALFKSQAVSQGDFDEARARFDAAEQSYIELKSAHALLVAGPRPEKIAQAEARVAVQQAAVELISDRIKKYTISSSFDGYVVSKFSENGAWVKGGDPVFEVVALDEVEFKAYVTEQHIQFVQIGMQVRVEVPSVANQIFSGTVSQIIPQADPKAKTFPVTIRAKNLLTADGPVLKSGMYARVNLPTGEQVSSLLVHKDAIVLGGARPVLFLVKGSEAPKSDLGKVLSVPVELGVVLGDWICVRGEGIEEGDVAVVEGNERLRPDQNVSIISERNPPEKLGQKP